MTADSVLAVLREHASAETLAQMGPRYGIHAASALGVPMAAMKRIARDLGHDHALAAELWLTGVYEARTVAAFVDEPALVTLEQMDAWCADFDNWALCDTVCFSLFDRAPDAWSRLEPWARDEREFVRRASFALLWSLALHDRSADDARFVAGLALVERYAADERPLVTKSMSMSLRAIRRRSPSLEEAVRATAARLAEADSGPSGASDAPPCGKAVLEAHAGQVTEAHASGVESIGRSTGRRPRVVALDDVLLHLPGAPEDPREVDEPGAGVREAAGLVHVLHVVLPHPTAEPVKEVDGVTRAPRHPEQVHLEVDDAGIGLLDEDVVRGHPRVVGEREELPVVVV